MCVVQFYKIKNIFQIGLQIFVIRLKKYFHIEMFSILTRLESIERKLTPQYRGTDNEDIQNNIIHFLNDDESNDDMLKIKRAIVNLTFRYYAKKYPDKKQALKHELLLLDFDYYAGVFDDPEDLYRSIASIISEVPDFIETGLTDDED